MQGKVMEPSLEIDELAQAQVMSYLKATRHRPGLLINFIDWILKSGIQCIIGSEPG